MSFYLDTSAIISVLVGDDHSDRANAWLAEHDGGDICISHWTAPEVSSALAIRIRRDVLTAAGRDYALSTWNRLSRDSFRTLAVDQANFIRAAALVDRYTLGLRAPDALHLAIAEAAGATMVTFDERLKSACLAVGLDVAEV
ncbi:type II toxin-antitoxin system VapC family toxin [Sphingomonas sp. SUN039]|uniref:type II toxin-antitoxin system VapC family toxin n=1 Tax=Sphingomonas sp. SUN039 TaxID=2937787 RepID=UPI002164A638|nr:type II toxin-antitoxin system VapC family toxin [Sphingomonas sp. SUN039]UVO52907.1 type II toxin-antitoxin system VapC family toxin [Sphingomonas sp. SUN039]